MPLARRSPKVSGPASSFAARSSIRSASHGVSAGVALPSGERPEQRPKWFRPTARGSPTKRRRPSCEHEAEQREHDPAEDGADGERARPRPGREHGERDAGGEPQHGRQREAAQRRRADPEPLPPALPAEPGGEEPEERGVSRAAAGRGGRGCRRRRSTRAARRASRTRRAHGRARPPRRRLPRWRRPRCRRRSRTGTCGRARRAHAGRRPRS